MERSRKKIHVVGERRAQLDVARFADALIAFALHRLSADAKANPATSPTGEPDQERPS
ncbi:hypothetical protein [Candidatus Protofrankia californiensis]|uniref:hypothetical protein n=1 Tax=Candidatus Protofrankia californiensis TaxID=1839754 RepID=UPI0013EA8734|nr:hypothetical protein [Candidatus Protofrankia californiensis]